MSAPPPGFILDGAPRTVRPAPQAPTVGPPIFTAPPKAPSPAPAPTALQVRDQQLQEEKATRDRIEWEATHNPDGTPKATADTVPAKGSAEEARRNATLLLQAAGVDIARGVDPVSDLIRGSTSGRVQRFGAELYGDVTGDATDGMENIAKLQTIVSDMTLQLTGGSLGNQISNADREFIMQRVGNLGDASVPANQRLAAWEQVRQRMANLTGTKWGSEGRSSVIEPTQQDIYRQGIVFNADRTSGDRRRADFIQERYGITEQQEDLLVGMWNANQGNQNLSLAGVREWYEKNGFEVPPDSELEPAIERARAGGDFSNLDASGADEAMAPLPPASVRSAEGGFGQSVDATVRGTADVLTMGLADEIAAAGGTIFSGGTMDENLRYQRGIDRFDEENNAGYRLGGQLAGGFMLPGGSIKSVKQGAGVGAAYGGAYGFGSGDGDIGDRLLGAAGGAVTGGGVGGAVGKFASRTPKPPKPPSGPTGRETVEAGARINVTPLAADVGGPLAAYGTAITRATPGGVLPIAKGAQRVVDEAEAARNQVAQIFGESLAEEAAGDAARTGALAFRRNSRDAIGRLYDRAANDTAGVQIPATRAVAALDDNIAELSAVPGASGQVAALQALKGEIERIGPLSVPGLRAMRTAMRDRFMKEGLVGSDLERRVNQVIDAASEDMAAGLHAQGKTEAASLFREADRAWRERAQTMQDVVMPIIGKRGEKSGEQVFRALQSASEGNNSRFVKFMDSLPDEERNTVAASIIGALGRPGAGQQGAVGEGFSLGKFLTDWNKMGETARNALLGPQARANLNDLATVAAGSKKAEAYRNWSNTGLILGAWGTGTLEWLTMGMTVVGQYGAGHLLASPQVTRQLAKIGRAKTPQARARLIDGLGDIATRQPVIANDVLSLQETLLRGLSQSPGQLAAAEEPGNRRPEPVE